MADGQAEIRRFIQIHAGICGVLYVICGLLVFACCVSGFAIQHGAVVYDYPLFGCGFILGLIGSVPWAMFTGINYLILSCQANARKRSHLHKSMLEFQFRWSFFFMLILLATLVVLGTALKQSGMADTRIKALTIVSIVGTGLALFLTTVWLLCFPKHQGVFGLKVAGPDKATLLSSFKRHGTAFILIGLHQLVWALVAFAVKSFDVTDEAIRIVAFSLGGFLNCIFALLAGIVCFLTVSYLTKKETDWKVKTKTMLVVHRTWTLPYLAFCIAGVALFGHCFKTISQTNEFGEWESNVLIVASYIFSLVGNVLLGYLFLALTVIEKECTVFGINVDDKNPAPAPAPPKPTASSNGTTATTTTTTTTARSATATTTVTASTPKTTTSSTASTATSIATTSTSGIAACTSAANGASGTSRTITDIEEIRERNRLLEEQIRLEQQLNDLRRQNVARPEEYPPLYVREAPSAPAPPSYDEIANSSEKN